MSADVPQYGVWLLTLLIGLAGRATAQQRPQHFEFGHIREQDGLSSRKIFNLLHDRDGYLWIATNTGLNRFDGTHFVHFRHQRNNPHSLLNNQVYALCEDNKGRIWATFENGVSCYDKTSGRFSHITTVGNKPLGVCKNIRCDRDGNIWFTSRDRGLFGYTIETGEVQYYPAYPTDSTRGVRTLPNGLVEDPYRPGFWVAESHGLRYFDTSRRQFTTYRNNPRHIPVLNPHDVSALAMDGNHLLIADHTDTSIVVYDLRRQRILKRIRPDTPQDRAEFFVATIFVDRRHNLWVSTWRGTRSFYIDTQTDRVTPLSHAKSEPASLGADVLWSGWQQADGTIWLGTTNGLAYTSPERALYEGYDLEALFPALTDERGIISFVEDPDGSWWLGTSIRGLLHYVPATDRLDVYRLPDKTNQYPWGLPITGLDQRQGELLVGSETAVYRFNKLTHQFQKIKLPPAARSVYLRTFRLMGNQYWVFGDGKRAFAYDLTRQQWQIYPIRSTNTDPRFLVRQTLLDRRGNLWLDIYPEGFARFSPQRKEFTVTDTRQADYEITLNSLTEDRDGTFLMSTDLAGLVTYDPLRRRDTIRSENEAMALSQCTAAQTDRFGNTWVANLNLFSVITAGKKQVLNFRLPINEYTAVYSTYLFPLRNGHLLSAQKGHLVELKPENLHPARRPEPVLLNRLRLNDTTLLLHGQPPPIRLKSDDNSFIIEFSTLAATANQQYRYKLEGYDDWQETATQTNAVYTKLPGGDYVFRVTAIAGDLRSRETTLGIHVATAFYNSHWFQSMLVVMVLAVLYSLYRYRLRQSARLHHYQIQMTRLERDKAEIQYHNLINHLNPHFLFNSLTSLNSLILTKPKDASLFLRKLSVIYRYILQNKDSELVSLQEELTFAQNYIDLQTTRFGDGLYITVDVTPDSLTRRIVPVTLQNLLENAIKHNIVSDDCPLTILIYTDTDTLFVQNSLQRKSFVETSNQQGLTSLKSLYRYLGPREVGVDETVTEFRVSVPLL